MAQRRLSLIATANSSLLNKFELYPYIQLVNEEFLFVPEPVPACVPEWGSGGFSQLLSQAA